MKNNKLVLVIVSIFLFMLFIPYAEAGLCTKSKYNSLIEKAKEIVIDYDSNEIILKNVDDNLLVLNDNSYLKPDNGIVKTNLKPETKEYSFLIYGGYETDCTEEYIYTVSSMVEVKSNLNYILLIITMLLVTTIIYLIFYRKKVKNEKK